MGPSRLQLWMRSVIKRRRAYGLTAKNKVELSGKAGKRWVALWGNGDQGRLGLSESGSQFEPVLCRALESHEPCSVSCGGAHTLILTDKGRVFATGLNSSGQLGVPLKRESSFQVARLMSGEETARVSWDSANKMESLAGMRLKALALGTDHSLGLAETGQVLSWGTNRFGCLGHGEMTGFFDFFKDTNEYTPRIIHCLEKLQIRSVSAGLVHSACADDSGTIYSFGQGSMCQLGLGNNNDASQPCPIPDLPRVSSISCGGYHTGAITQDGDIYTWGSNEHGCLGSGFRASSKPLRLESLAEAFMSEISCGWKHTAAISDGYIFSWGWGGSYGTYATQAESSGGQLGVGTDFDFFEPVPIEMDDRLSALHVSCGFNHTAAILEEIEI
ncbi:ultraviolet-B receptor UVR8 isoform X2 [Selaginella moellendorffii]|uniref:ultraviolet-B receptor UVR8 isoform X2 n=1 Tax=Selaginella moellendorffii TaxID=88036 RepID=UPI000D1C828C|nr:ultraviolet-B receptor UVR8 isoform X2 [Selaginella moellendorffii]|eukprot:XP_024534524.1 ultraviolet-B receptor UVR8 isoform X2 [Selaginella moellendorffii]